MNVYVESNFIFELTFLQDEHESCERILGSCETGQAKLFLPAYSFAEPLEKLNRSSYERSRLADLLSGELRQLTRSAPYKTETETIQTVISLFARSSLEERQRFADTRERLLRIAEIIPLDANILSNSVVCEQQYSLSPQDALVFASILQHLEANGSSTTTSCFVSRDEHFDNADVRETLAKYHCTPFHKKFEDGYRYLQSQM